MSKPTTEEIAYWFYGLCQYDPGELTERSQLMRQVICSLIKSNDKGPEVSRERIEECAKACIAQGGKWRGVCRVMDEITQLLREAGVRVKEEK